jgi:hypothetical protein
LGENLDIRNTRNGAGHFLFTPSYSIKTFPEKFSEKMEMNEIGTWLYLRPFRMAQLITTWKKIETGNRFGPLKHIAESES